jgi:hypothetical protein
MAILQNPIVFNDLIETNRYGIYFSLSKKQSKHHLLCNKNYLPKELSPKIFETLGVYASAKIISAHSTVRRNSLRLYDLKEFSHRCAIS